jgi:dephospho-CoA kinase
VYDDSSWRTHTGSLEQCRKALDAQMPTRLKVAKCDTAIDNDSSIAALHEKVEQCLKRLRAEAQSHPLGFLLRPSPR